MTPKILIRHIEPRDWNDIAAVQRATYGEEAESPEAYQWWSSGLEGEDLAGCVALCENTVVGVQPMQFFPYRAGGLEMKGALLTGVAVHPNFRLRGIFSRMIEYCESDAWEHQAAFVATLPNERSKPGFLKRDYLDLGERRLLLCPLMLLGKKNGYGKESIQEVRALSEDWAEVFDSYTRMHGRLMLERSLAWLRWRYQQNPEQKSPYRFFESRSQHGKLEAVVVMVEDRRKKIPLWYMMELAYRDSIAGKVLVSEVLRLLRGEGGLLAGAVCSSQDSIDLLKNSGFIPVPFWLPLKAFHTVAKFNPKKSLSDTFHTISSWEFALGDWDNL